MDVNSLIDYFECIAAMHANINSFRTGDKWEIAISGVDDYPQLYLLQNFDLVGEDNRKTWSVRFRVHTIQLRDESNERQLLDDTFVIFQQVLEYLRQQSGFIVSSSYDAFSFTEDSDDYLCGWAVTINLTAPTSVNRCTIDDAFPPGGCDYSTQLIFSSTTRGIDGFIINGVLNTFNGPYLINSDDNGVAEFARLEADLTAAGYTFNNTTNVSGNTVVSFIIIITQTLDVFTALISQRGDSFLMTQSNCT